MSAIGPGDFVVCVKAIVSPADTWARRDGAYLTLGKVYRVVEVDPHCTSTDFGRCEGLVLDAPETRYSVPDGVPSWAVQRFRPIYRPRKGAFDHLLVPQDIKVDA